MRKNALILGIIFSIFASASLFSQRSSPLAPINTDPNLQFIGMYVGFGQNFQAGKIYPSCLQCEFEKGNKFGFTAGLLYEYRLIKSLYIGTGLEYNYLGIDAFFTEIEPQSIKIPINAADSILEKVNIKFQHEANVNIHNLALVPYLKYQPFDFMFIRLGIGVGYNISSGFTHKKTLAQNTVKLSNGETAAIKIPNESKNSVLEDGELLQASPLQVYINPALGFDLPLSDHLIFSPIFSYSNALMNIATRGIDPKVHYWRIMLELRYNITPDSDY